MKRGYFGIGIQNGKSETNLGTLWRTAHSFGADFIFTIGERYKPQASDTTKAWLHLPLHRYESPEHLASSLPDDASVVGVEILESARPIGGYHHPERAVYVLGAEDRGLSKEMVKLCKAVLVLPGTMCINVAVAGSIVMYDRLVKSERSS